MNVDPGQLKKKIQIIKRVETVDADGYRTYTETVVHTAYADFSRKSGKEVYEYHADFSEVRARFLIRYTKKAIDRKMIIRYAGNDYEIEYVNDYGDTREFIELWAVLKSPEKDI